MRKNGRDKAIPIAFAVSALALLVGCGGGGGDSTTASTNSPDALPLGHSVSDSAADLRAKSILSQMTLDQKIALVHGHGSPNGATTYVGLNFPVVPNAMPEAVAYIPGIAALGIPDNNMVDASSGVYVPSLSTTALPATVGLAATWNKDLALRYGKRIGTEIRNLGFTTALGGGVNLIRDPRNGRGFEYMGEDPILSGELGAQRTIGVQSQQVMSAIKHYAFNSYETNRQIGNSVIDEQSMHETELLAFEIAITKGNPSYVMCAFNQVNSQYSCENSYLLNDVLKSDWGFKGMVVSDWGAQSSTIAAANNGLDEEEPGMDTEDTPMPTFMQYYIGGPWFIKKLTDAVANGDVPMSRLNDMVFRKLRTMIAVGIMDNPPVAKGSINESAGNADSKKVADEAMVLLKNTVASKSNDSVNVLPLKSKPISKVLVVGMYADKGVLSGGGSGGSAPLIENQVQLCGQLKISPYASCPVFIGETPLASIKNKFPSAEVTYLSGEDATAAAQAAADADVTIIFAGQWLNEGTDVSDFSLTSPIKDTTGVFNYDQDALIESVAASAKRSVVVLENGQPVKMPWLDSVDAVLDAWYPGVKGAESIADILYGDVNPSGKLPVTFPVSEADLVSPKMPTNLGQFMGAPTAMKHFAGFLKSQVTKYYGAGAYDKLRAVNYSEKLAWNGYKWMDENGITPLFPFGYGLSYSTFQYSGGSAQLNSNDEVEVTFNIQNTSNVAGSEIAQVYVSLPSDVPGNKQPPKKLVGWNKVELAAGETKAVTVKIPKKYISVWDAQSTHSWILTPGAYNFVISDSSDANSANAITASVNISN